MFNKGNFFKTIKFDIIIIIMLPFVLTISYLSSKFPIFVENIYSKNIFIVISSIQASIFSLIPFSVFEFIILILMFVIFYYPFSTIFKLLKDPSGVTKTLLKFILRSISFFSILYFSFLFLWGFNYNRLPLSDLLDLKIEKSNITDLEIICQNLYQNALNLRKIITTDSTDVMTFKTNLSNIIFDAHQGFDVLSKNYDFFEGRFSKPKKVFLSELMSIMNGAGIYSPFTGEANINANLPEVSLPFTICHEMAHQRGFAREDEANFISYLACKNHPDPQFKYSGYLKALIYSMNKLYKYDRDKYDSINENYSHGMKKDIEAIKIFWGRYKGSVYSNASNKLNDTYLKANNQKDGVQSYGRVVDLLIAEYRKNKK